MLNLVQHPERCSLQLIGYSDQFRRMILDMHAGLEESPFYDSYIDAHLGGESSRLIAFSHTIVPEIEHHCGKLAGRRVLDFGCGTGASTAALAECAEDVCAFDVWQGSIDIARQRLQEHGHGLQDRVRFFCASDIADMAGEIGTFDVIVALGVIEHLPITVRGLREHILRSAAGLLNKGGCLFLGDTPNRFWPHDSHTTRLWWIPWTKPGSKWALSRAISKGRYSRTEHYSEGPLGLEEQGAWGATFWEINKHLRSCGLTCVNLTRGHREHLSYCGLRSRKETIFESIMRPTACKILRAPLTAFAPYINNLTFRRD